MSRATCYGAGKTIVANEQVRVSVVVKERKKQPDLATGRPALSTDRYYACNQKSMQRFLLLKGGEFENDGYTRLFIANWVLNDRPMSAELK